MKLDTLIRDTFTAHEHLAPDAAAVLASVHDEFGHRGGLRRPLAVAASVALVGGAAAAAAELGGSDPARHPADAGSPVSSSAAAPRVQALTMPFDLGWLPSGTVHYLARRINVGAAAGSHTPVFDGEYLMAIDTSSGTVVVDVQQLPGPVGEARFKCGPGQAVTIDGRSGTESADAGGACGYEVYFTDSARGTMYVNVAAHHGDQVAAGDLVSIGRQVAGGVSFPGTAEVTPEFGVGYVPDGLRVRAFDVAAADSTAPSAGDTSGTGTSYDLGDDAHLDGAVDIGSDFLPMPGQGTPGADVQGRPTLSYDDDGYRTVVVKRAVDGRDVRLSGKVPLAELYRIADGLVLP